MTSAHDRQSPDLIRVLGLWDIVFMNIVAVVGLRWISRGARLGAPSVLLWTLACLTFFLPMAAALIELSSRYPEQGGLYAWTRRALGPLHGFICGWCLWVNNLFYFPALLLFGAANALLVFGDRFAALAENQTYSVIYVLTSLWLLVALNIVGFQAGRWVQNLGAHATWAPAALLIVAGATSFAMFGSATTFTLETMIPGGDLLETISLWSAMCFAFSGFEVTSYVSQEVKRPHRTIPLGVLIAGFVVMLIYIAGSVSVLVAVPADALAERSGIADAIDLVSSKIGLAGLGGLTGALLALGTFAGTSSWVAGAARVPFAAGIDRVLPPMLSRLHPRYRTPHIALIVQGIVASLIFLVSVFLTVTGASSTVQEAYDIMVNLTILIYFVPYLYLFVVLVRLRRGFGETGGSSVVQDSQETAAVMWVPGGTLGLWTVAILGSLSTGISLLLVFVPPPGTSNVMNYEVNLLLQAFVILAIGFFFYARSRRQSSNTSSQS